MDKFLFKRGNQAKLPQLQTGEPFLSKDEERLYIGGNNGNIPLPNKQDMDEVTTQLAETETEINQITTQLAEIAINVKTFGAVGDGVTDDTEAFRNAVNNANGNLLIPDGTFLINGVVSLKENLSIVGNTNSIIQFGDNGKFFLPKNAENISVEGITFRDNLKHTRVTEIGGSPYGTQIKVENNVFSIGDKIGGSNYGVMDKPYATIIGFDGITYTLDVPISTTGSLLRESWGPVVGTFEWKSMFEGGHFNHGTTIKKCVFDNARGYAFTLPESSNLLFEDVTIQNNGLDMCLISSESQKQTNIIFNRCTLKNHIDFGKQGICPVVVNDTALIEGLHITNCVFEGISESAFSGNYAYGHLKGVRILNNTFTNIDLNSISTGGDDIQIKGNYLLDNHITEHIKIGAYKGATYTQSSLVENVTIENNYILGENGISITKTPIENSQNYITPNNLKIRNNKIHANYVGVYVEGTNVDIRDNHVTSINDNGDPYHLGAVALDGTGIIQNNRFFGKAILKYTQNSKLKILNNVFGSDGTTTTDINLFNGSNSPNDDILIKGNTFYEDAGFSLISNGEGHKIEYTENQVIRNNGSIIDVPRIKGLGGRFNHNESIPNGNIWISNIDNHWISKVTASNLFYAQGKPSEGDFTQGDIVFNVSGGTPSMWVRLTTGSNHVTGVDWKEV